jgi:hypothetical protein
MCVIDSLDNKTCINVGSVGLENMMRRDHSEDLGADGRIILEWILGKWGGKVWNRRIWLEIGISGCSSEHGNETSGFTGGEEYLD